MEGLQHALGGLLQRFEPADTEEARFRSTERNLNPRAGRDVPAISNVPKPFSDAWGVLQARAGGDLPHVAAIRLAAAEAAAADDDGDPLTLCVGDVVVLNGGNEPYWGLVVQLWDPQTAQATYAHGVAARLWPRSELEAYGWARAAAQLASGEVALSNYFDYIRPNSVVGKLQLVPEPWRDPTLPASRELYFKVCALPGAGGRAGGGIPVCCCAV